MKTKTLWYGLFLGFIGQSYAIDQSLITAANNWHEILNSKFVPLIFGTGFVYAAFKSLKDSSAVHIAMAVGIVVVYGVGQVFIPAL